MRDWKLYEEAKRLRDSGLTFKAVGEALGVSASRARDIVKAQERREAFLAYIEEHPRAPEWFDGLNASTARRLERCGFNSREECMPLAKDDLQMLRGSVVLPGLEEDRRVLWKWPQQRKATAAELERAKRMLERHGYKVESPNSGIDRIGQ